MPGRIGSAKPTRARSSHGTVVEPPGERDQPLAGGRRRLGQRRPGPRRRRVLAAACAITTSGAPSASSSIRPSGRRTRVRVTGSRSSAGSAWTSEAASSAIVPPSSSTAARSDRVNEPGVTSSPGQASSSARRASDRSAQARLRVVDGPLRRPHRRHDEPVLGDRPGLVGHDQVDRPQRLLGVEPPDQHAPLQEPVGAEAEDHGEQHRRLLGDRRDRRRDAGEQVLAQRMPAQEPHARW